MPTTTEATARSFEEYAAATWPSLYRRAYLLSGNHADAEDLAQETLVKVQAAWTRVSRAESSEAYVRRILTNTFLSSRRARGRRPELLVGEDPPEPDVAPPAGPEDRLALWPHVRALPPRQRAVIVLRYYEQLSEAEIADTLGCSRGTVKSTAHRALHHLRTAIDGSEVR